MDTLIIKLNLMSKGILGLKRWIIQSSTNDVLGVIGVKNPKESAIHIPEKSDAAAPAP